MQSSAKHSGFSLVEILISIAVIAILTTITFVGFAQEKRKSDARRIAEQLQVDLQSAQAKAQSAVIYSARKLCSGSANDGYFCTADIPDCDLSRSNTACSTATGGIPCGRCVFRSPVAHGIVFGLSPVFTYAQCFDLNLDAAAATHPDGHCSGVDELSTVKTLPTGLTLSFKYNGTTCGSNCEAHILFSVPSGNAIITKTGSSTTYSSVEVMIKDANTNVCYSVSVQQTSGTVSRRKVASGC